MHSQQHDKGSHAALVASDARPSTLHCGDYVLSLAVPVVMGIVNVTPDSFSDGGAFFDAQRAIAHGQKLIDDGADILDIGGESTRPGAAAVDASEELRRVLPVIEALAGRGIPLSIDTQKPEVMRAAIAAGAAMVNDVNALRAPGAIEVCAASNVAVCLMHMQGDPQSMQAAPHYDEVIRDVRDYLLARAGACEAAGIARERIVIDPGFGFGKTLEHNLSLLTQMRHLTATGYATLAGLSRKSMFRALFALEAHERLVPSVIAALRAVEGGAAIVRVHDVRETRHALALWRKTSSF